MRVVLTGGTGYIGGAVLRELLAAGHEVTAPVRSEDAAAKVKAAGADPVVGDLTDRAWTTAQFRAADAAVHTAATGGADSADFDRAVVDAAAAAFAGSGKTYVHTSGIWVWGARPDVAEEHPFDPPALTAWRGEVEADVLRIEGARTVIVAPGIVFGHGGGIPNVIAGAPRTDDGALTLVGGGDQHWTTVHVDDVADLYVRALTNPAATGYYIGASGQNPTVRELGEAAARGSGGSGAVVADDLDATRARLGNPLFADALFLDQQATGEKARTELGWSPSRPSLVEDLASGGYAG